MENAESSKSARRRLIRAVACVYQHNRDLILKIGAVRGYYAGQSRVRPRQAELLSAVLNCEGNNAHVYLEGFFSAIKSIGIGNLPVRTIEYWFALSSARLLNNLQLMADLLPSGIAPERLCNAIERARCHEEKMCNFILGRSGAGDEITHGEILHRLDKLLSGLKDRFEEIHLALHEVEGALRKRDERLACMRSKIVVRYRGVDRDCNDRDRRRILGIMHIELKRRLKHCADKGIKTTAKKLLRTMYSSESWGKRCHMWSFETLYTNMVRRGLSVGRPTGR